MKTIRKCLLSVVALLAAVAPLAAQQKDLTYHTVPPCFFVNTIVAGGAFAANETRTYNVVGNGSFASQGGSATGCGVPSFSNGIARVQAVAINIVAVNPSGAGHIWSVAADTSILSSTPGFLNFTGGITVANTGPVAVAQTSGVGDIKINVAVSGAHVVASVVGYYTRFGETILVGPGSTPAASGTALLNALTSIADNSASKRYLIKLEPGTYDVGTTMVVMKPYVDIEGSGQQATVIQGQGSTDFTFSTGVVKGAASSELRNLQVRSTSTASLPYSIGIVAVPQANTRIKDVTVVSTGPGVNWGLRVFDGMVTIEDVTIDVQGGSTGYGISNVGSGAPLDGPVVERVKIKVTGSAEGNGLIAVEANLKSLRDLQVNVSGGITGYGIRVQDFGTGQGHVSLTSSKITVQGTTSASYGLNYNAVGQVKVEHSQIITSSSGNSYGLSGTNGTAIINHSELTGATNTVSGFLFSFIGASWLNGGPASASGCAGVYDENYVFTAGPACP